MKLYVSKCSLRVLLDAGARRLMPGGDACSRLTGPMPTPDERSKVRARGEEAVGELAQALIENPLFNGALARALGAGERAMSAQRSAMGALNVASGSDVERLEQRLRSLSGRLESIEDRIDELLDEVSELRARTRSSSS
jgi:chromosome segregation ATPase